MYEILYNDSGADRVEPVSVDEAYLEFIIPLPQRRGRGRDGDSGRGGRERGCMEAESEIEIKVARVGDRQNERQSESERNSGDDYDNLFPAEFGMLKAKELRERIFRDTGCSARSEILIYFL